MYLFSKVFIECKIAFGLPVVPEENKINPVIDKIFSYKQSAEAHAYIQERKNFGKVLLDFNDE